jgi:4-amino-4-deoxy-L-arabinose transferase-like glycosyltransferase
MTRYNSLFGKLPFGRNLFIGLLIITVALTIFFRLWALPQTPPGLYPDEVQAVNANKFKIFFPNNNGREGLFINIVGLSVKIFGENKPWATRLPSAIFGILSVLGIYMLTKELFGKEVALLATFFAAVGFWHVNFSRIAFRGIMVPMLFSWAFYFLIAGMRRFKWYYFILGGIIFGLGFHTYIAYRFTPFILIIALIIFYLEAQQKNKIINNKSIKKPCALCWGVLLFLVTTFIVASPIGFYFLENPQDFLGRATGVSVFASEKPLQEFGFSIAKTLGMFNFSGDFNWRHNFAGQPQLFWPVGIFFLIGFFGLLIKTISNLKKKDWQLLAPSIFLYITWAIMLLPSILTAEGLPHALRSIGATVPTYIFAGLGIYIIAEKITSFHHKYTMRILPVLILIIVILGGVAYAEYEKYFLSWGKNVYVEGAFTNYFAKVGHYLNTLPPETKKYVLVNESGVLVNGIPMPAQTVMFITNKNPEIIYLLPENLSSINTKEPFIITPLKYEVELLTQLENRLNTNLTLEITPDEVFVLIFN